MYYIHAMVCGVRHLHAAGKVHRDIKPGNLVVDSVGALKIADFGCAFSMSNPAGFSWRCAPKLPSFSIPLNHCVIAWEAYEARHSFASISVCGSGIGQHASASHVNLALLMGGTPALDVKAHCLEQF